MKNITVSVPDEVYLRAKIKAAERSTSVSAMVRLYLVELSQEDSEFDRLLRLQNEVVNSIAAFEASSRLSRDELYRDALR